MCTLTQITHSPVISTEGMVMVDHAYNSGTKETKVGGLLQGWVPSWATKRVPVKPNPQAAILP